MTLTSVETKEENDILVDQIKALNPGTTIKGNFCLFEIFLYFI
jgi:hypothetical protein